MPKPDPQTTLEAPQIRLTSFGVRCQKCGHIFEQSEEYERPDMVGALISCFCGSVIRVVPEVEQ